MKQKYTCPFDNFVVALNDVPFELYDRDCNDNVVKVKNRRGAWLIVDNGYHLNWSVTTSRHKITSDDAFVATVIPPLVPFNITCIPSQTNQW
jgi:hypothetical protein